MKAFYPNPDIPRKRGKCPRKSGKSRAVTIESLDDSADSRRGLPDPCGDLPDLAEESGKWRSESSKSLPNRGRSRRDLPESRGKSGESHREAGKFRRDLPESAAESGKSVATMV